MNRKSLLEALRKQGYKGKADLAEVKTFLSESGQDSENIEVPGEGGVAVATKIDTIWAKTATLNLPPQELETETETGEEPAAETKAAPKATPKPAASVAAATPVIAPPKADDGAKARAQLEGKPVQPASAQTASAPAEGRFVVQVGAFADATKAREARQKLERAGLKTYTQVAETKDGKRIRVRVGPFGSKAEADKAAGKIKELDLPAAILTL